MRAIVDSWYFCYRPVRATYVFVHRRHGVGRLRVADVLGAGVGDGVVGQAGGLGGGGGGGE